MIRVVLMTTGFTFIIYAYLLLILRVTGNRVLAKLRAFDFIVTIALGSILASTTLAESPRRVLEGGVAATVLVLLQGIVAKLSARSSSVNRAVTRSPTLIVFEGRVLDDALRSSGVTEDELRLILRREGVLRVEDAGIVLLETNGEFTVVETSKLPPDPRAPGGTLRTALPERRGPMGAGNQP